MVRPGHSVRPKIRLTEFGTDLITILRCLLSFKTVVTIRNIIVFKKNIPGQKTAIRVVHALHYLVPLAATTLHLDQSELRDWRCSSYTCVPMTFQPYLQLHRLHPKIFYAFFLKRCGCYWWTLFWHHSYSRAWSSISCWVLPPVMNSSELLMLVIPAISVSISSW